MAAPAQQSHTTHKGAWPLFVVGLLALAFCIAITLIQIQTNEALFLHEPAMLLKPRWQTFIQPYDLVMGNLDNDLAKAVIWSWVSELIYLICIVGYEDAHHAVSSTWKKLAPIFMIVSLLIIGFNIYTDYMYGPSGFWTQAGFAIAMSTAVVFFGIIGAHFIQVAIGRVRH